MELLAVCAHLFVTYVGRGVRVEGVLLPLAFAQSTSILATTFLIAARGGSRDWFFESVGNRDLAYAQYVLAHAVTPFFIAVLQYGAYVMRGNSGIKSQWLSNSFVVFGFTLVPLMFWSSTFDAREVYRTTAKYEHMMGIYAGASFGSSLFATAALGARPLRAPRVIHKQ